MHLQHTGTDIDRCRVDATTSVQNKTMADATTSVQNKTMAVQTCAFLTYVHTHNVPPPPHLLVLVPAFK